MTCKKGGTNNPRKRRVVNLYDLKKEIENHIEEEGEKDAEEMRILSKLDQVLSKMDTNTDLRKRRTTDLSKLGGKSKKHRSKKSRKSKTRKI